MELSQKLKKLRKEQGLTQLDLSETLFVSRQAISGWEAGTSRPSTENLQFLSKLYNVPLEYLLDDSKDLPINRINSEKIAKEAKDDIKEKRKKVPVLIIIGTLVLVFCIALMVALFRGDQKTLDLEEIPGEVMPATESDFNFSL